MFRKKIAIIPVIGLAVSYLFGLFDYTSFNPKESKSMGQQFSMENLDSVQQSELIKILLESEAQIQDWNLIADTLQPSKTCSSTAGR